MPVFTEVLPANKTSPHRAMKYTPACVGVGVAVIEDKTTSTRYAVCVLPHGGVRLTKAGGGENYVVRPTACECKGWLFSRTGTPCKHMEAAAALVANGWLDHDGRETVTDRDAEVQAMDAFFTSRGI